MDAAEIECYSVNANIVIARRWLSKCCVNVLACMQHVIVKMSFTNVEALGDA